MSCYTTRSPDPRLTFQSVDAQPNAFCEVAVIPGEVVARWWVYMPFLENLAGSVENDKLQWPYLGGGPRWPRSSDTSLLFWYFLRRLLLNGNPSNPQQFRSLLAVAFRWTWAYLTADHLDGDHSVIRNRGRQIYPWSLTAWLIWDPFSKCVFIPTTKSFETRGWKIVLRNVDAQRRD